MLFFHDFCENIHSFLFILYMLLEEFFKYLIYQNSS